jgi:hypothetical protein
LRVITPAPRDVWSDVLESATTAFVYQTPIGVDATCADLGWTDVSRLYEFADGRQLILPLLRTKSFAHTFAVECSPTIGSLVSRGPPRVEELKAIFADLAERRLIRVTLSPTPLEAGIWEAAASSTASRLPRVGHVLDLGGGFETVWKKRFNNQARRACRKADKTELEIERDTSGALIDEFYELYLKSVERWANMRGEPISIAHWRAGRRLPLANLKRKVAVLGDTCNIWVARADGRPAAAIVVLQGANAHYTLGAMDQELAGPLRASFKLQKMAIEHACKSGCRYYSMGETGTSESLARFKEHFGALAYRYWEYRIERLPITPITLCMRNFAKRVLTRRRGRNAASA